MLVNLMPPVLAEYRLREPEIVVAPAEPERGFVVVHPRYRSWLARCGLTTSQAMLALPGEIVSGHPNRHVMQVTVKSASGTRSLFLKREHAVGWRVRRKNRLADYGRVSRSEREAKVLERLEAAGLPGPHWVAYGEDGAGRAFLLVDELTGYRELREMLSDTALSPVDRRTLATRLGEALADLHAAGFDTPDLAAKHVFVRPGSFSVTLLDWQSSGAGGKPADALAALHASLAEWLATPRERLRALRAYRRRLGASAPRFSLAARELEVQSQKLLARSSIREQRQPNAANPRLVWLADEAVCAIPEVAKTWPRPAICPPYYADDATDGGRFDIRLGDDRPATLLRFRTPDVLGRCWATLRGKSWRSPAAKLSRLFFHLQKAGVPVPPLYAFGQRHEPFRPADSFLAYGTVGAVKLDAWLADNPAERERLLVQLGGIVRAIHDADCTLGPAAESFAVARSRLIVDPTRGAKLGRPLTFAHRLRDLADTLRAFAPSADDCRRVLDGYAVTPGTAARVFERRLLRRVGAAT